MILEFINNNMPLLAHHSAALQVAIPLLLAIFCVLSRSSKVSYLIYTICSAFCFFNAIYLFESVGVNDVITYHMGGWMPPIGIEYRIDKLSAFFILLVSFVALILAPYSWSSVKNEIDDKKISIFYALFLLCYAGLLGILSTNDIFNIYVFLEISSLATYVLIAMGKDRRALSSAFSYLILGTIGATFILIAIGLLYIVTGSLNLTDISSRITDIESNKILVGAFAFLSIGVALKIALFPLHIWLTNAYAYSPSFVSSFLSATATKVSVYVFLRFLFSLFGYELTFEQMDIGTLLIILSIAAIVFGNLSAIYNPNLKRLLAFSSVSQMGYITLMIALGTAVSMKAGLIQVAGHGIAKALLFASAGAVFYRTRKVRLEDMQGLAKRLPLSFAGIIIGGLSLIGVPLTVGFVSKWNMIIALAEQHHYFIIALVLIASLLAVIYVWKIVEALYFGELDKKHKNIRREPLTIKITIIALIITNVYFGLFPADLTNVAEEISSKVFGL